MQHCYKNKVRVCIYYSHIIIYCILLNHFFKVSIGLKTVDKGVQHFKAEGIVSLC